jgi:hypothetical protein|tara:strand:+ start:8730 stop:9308 length:579 start_codon:yes stop_codon:yes gene_type:complete
MSDLELAKTSLAEVIEGFSNLTENESQELRQLCEQLVQLRDLEEKATEALKGIKASLRKYTRELVPDAMDELGMQALTTSNGVDITISDDLHVHITEAKKPEAFNWLRDNNHEDIIKNQVVVSFNKNEDNVAGAFYSDAVSGGHDVQRKETVHNGTLRAFVRDMRAKGIQIPVDTFGVYEGRIAKISPYKGE